MSLHTLQQNVEALIAAYHELRRENTRLKEQLATLALQPAQAGDWVEEKQAIKLSIDELLSNIDVLNKESGSQA